MAALLILGGFLWMVLGVLWLIVLAFKVSLMWGVGSLFPPVLLVFIIRCWTVARKAVMFSLLGLVPLIAGVTQLASMQPERFEALLSLDWLQPAQEESAAVHNTLFGELYGQTFKPLHGELLDGVLVLREGDGFFAQRELRITLPKSLLNQDLATLRLDVLPQDSGELPEVEIMWLQPGQSLPEARRISRGYTLHLDLIRQTANQLQGGFHLVLPARFKTSMSGEVRLVTDYLNYVDGEVDRHFDGLSTLEYVLNEYFQRRYQTAHVQIEPFSVVALSTPLALTLTVQVDGLSRTESVRMLKSGEAGWYVAGEHYPEYVAKGSAVSTEHPLSADTAAKSAAVDRRVDFSLSRLLASPQQYLRLQMHITTRQGNQVTGRFMGLSDGGVIVISREVQAPGRVTFTLLPIEIEAITLLEP